MFQRISNSWDLMKSSAAVLRADKELVIFPVLSAIGVVLVTLTFAVPTFLLARAEQLEKGPFGYVLGFLFYLVTYFVIFFCNSALVGAAMIRLRGGDPTVKDGLRIAFSHVGAIFGYALISATVGIILKSLQERAGLLGRILVAAVGFVWNVTTFLAVPVLVVEGVGPVDAVKRSAALLKKTWGEQIIGNAGIGAIFALFFVALLFVAVPGVFLAVSTQSVGLIVAVSCFFGLLLVALAILNATLSSIYTAAVYLYAAEGTTGPSFAPAQIQGAFRPKKK